MFQHDTFLESKKHQFNKEFKSCDTPKALASSAHSSPPAPVPPIKAAFQAPVPHVKPADSSSAPPVKSTPLTSRTITKSKKKKKRKQKSKFQKPDSESDEEALFGPSFEETSKKSLREPFLVRENELQRQAQVAVVARAATVNMRQAELTGEQEPNTS